MIAMLLVLVLCFFPLFPLHSLAELRQYSPPTTEKVDIPLRIKRQGSNGVDKVFTEHFDSAVRALTFTTFGNCSLDADRFTKVRSRSPTQSTPSRVEICECYGASNLEPFDECEGEDDFTCIIAKCADDCAGKEAYCDSGTGTCALRTESVSVNSNTNSDSTATADRNDNEDGTIPFASRSCPRGLILIAQMMVPLAMALYTLRWTH
ncbi:hypothetical protein ACHAXS_010797 [Conticribra weissflogii]